MTTVHLIQCVYKCTSSWATALTYSFCIFVFNFWSVYFVVDMAPCKYFIHPMYKCVTCFASKLLIGWNHHFVLFHVILYMLILLCVDFGKSSGSYYHVTVLYIAIYLFTFSVCLSVCLYLSRLHAFALFSFLLFLSICCFLDMSELNIASYGGHT